MKPKQIHVLFGGKSNERLVSTATAQNMLRNLPEADAWFISKAEEIYLCPRDGVLAHQNPFTTEFRVDALGKPTYKSIDEALKAPGLQDSVLVLALHGQGVEDGALQAKLEKAGVAFTGSGSKASALAFDKLAAKKVALKEGVRTAEYQELCSTDRAAVAQLLTNCIRQFERVAVKPMADGSSVGLYIMDGRSNVEEVATQIAKDGRAYLIEEFIAGTELTVGVVDNGKTLRALPPSEVRLQSDANFDYNAKYLGKGVEELTPARVPAEVTRAAQELAVKMHRALGCEGYSRTDMIISREGPVYLETNTLPGMTAASFFPQQLAAEGREIREFLETEIERAWLRTQKARK